MKQRGDFFTEIPGKELSTTCAHLKTAVSSSYIIHIIPTIRSLKR